MNGMIDCRTVCERLSGYVRGHLREADADAIAGHLHRCSACRAALDLEQGLLALSDVRRSAPDDFAASVLARRRGGTQNVFARALRVSRTACTGALFRAFIDPLLEIDHRLYDTRAAIRRAVFTPLSIVQTRLISHMLTIYQHIATPLKEVGRAIDNSLAGGET